MKDEKVQTVDVFQIILDVDFVFYFQLLYL
jgi:hypothetical protein